MFSKAHFPFIKQPCAAPPRIHTGWLHTTGSGSPNKAFILPKSRMLCMSSITLASSDHLHFLRREAADVCVCWLLGKAVCNHSSGAESTAAFEWHNSSRCRLEEKTTVGEKKIIMQLLANALLAQRGATMERFSSASFLTLCYFQEGEKMKEDCKATEAAQKAAERKK